MAWMTPFPLAGETGKTLQMALWFAAVEAYKIEQQQIGGMEPEMNIPDKAAWCQDKILEWLRLANQAQAAEGQP